MLNSHPQLIRKGSKVLDLGAAPGGWSQVAVEAVSSRGIEPLSKGERFVGPKASSTVAEHDPEYSLPLMPTRGDNGSRVIAVDLLSIDPIPGAQIIMGDMTREDTQAKVIEICGGNKVDTVLSDMAHSFTGSRSADVVRVLDLCRTAFSVAEDVLKPNGHFVCKFIRSRTGSAEAYLICLNYRPIRTDEPYEKNTTFNFESTPDESKSLVENSLNLSLLQTLLSPLSASLSLSQEEQQQQKVAHFGPKIHHRNSRQTPLNEIDTKPRARPPMVPHWSELQPGTRVRVLLLSDLKGKPIGKGISNAGRDKLVDGEVEILMSRDYHRSGVKVRLTDGREGRVVEVIT
ncbi:rRNA methyltransferase 2, mitochondrial [Physocladia obscura]|uniref:rRNA methyltransferase 2, mitochondrial n=1 Tax=Physocladia obscura TaxID=109957 RepID=A0AAD5T8Z0_9FUNG|nr:rRNA methyltransferase 2, mitochondrial [Physocladia obscura]